MIHQRNGGDSQKKKKRIYRKKGFIKERKESQKKEKGFIEKKAFTTGRKEFA